jgi:hypothetical protein
VLATFAAWNDAMKFIRARHPGDEATTIATGHSGHASATGHYGWAIAGYRGEVKAQKNGVITGIYFDDKANRPRVLVGYVGEDGIKADTFYRIEDAKWTEVKA